MDLRNEEVVAYHGTPHRFDKFSTEKMGTGEGAQSFGWGLYFTDLESIANHYANQLAPDKIKINGVEVSSVLAQYLGQHYIPGQKRFADDTIEKTREELVYDKYEDSYLRHAIEELDGFGENATVETAPRMVYKVTLHKGKSPEQYNWLLWDKPVTDSNLKAALDILRSAEGGKEFQRELSNPIYWEKYKKYTGQDLYESLTDVLGDKGASLALLKHGVDGIKYPAESISRGATSETARGFNYVVFDENAVTIEKASELSEGEILKEEIPAFHGSGHDFDCFSLKYLGSGQGAQTFGWGLYFTNKRDIAEFYAKEYSDFGIDTLYVNTIPVYRKKELVDYPSPTTPREAAKYYISQEIGLDEQRIISLYNEYGKPVVVKLTQEIIQSLIDTYTSELDNTKDDKHKGYLTRLIEYLNYYFPKKDSDVIFKTWTEGKIYDVTIHPGRAPEQYDYLEWSSKLTDSQKNKILSQAEKESITNIDYVNFVKVEEFYEYLSNNPVLNSDKEASLFLLRAGIDGIVYKSDAGTGGKFGEGLNYVVFDENAIKITNVCQLKESKLRAFIRKTLIMESWNL